MALCVTKVRELYCDANGRKDCYDFGRAPYRAKRSLGIMFESFQLKKIHSTSVHQNR